MYVMRKEKESQKKIEWEDICKSSDVRGVAKGKKKGGGDKDGKQ
jgi:hypothetical protein